MNIILFLGKVKVTPLIEFRAVSLASVVAAIFTTSTILYKMIHRVVARTLDSKANVGEVNKLVLEVSAQREDFNQHVKAYERHQERIEDFMLETNTHMGEIRGKVDQIADTLSIMRRK